MKKLSIILTLILTLILTSCSNSTDIDKSSDTSRFSSETTTVSSMTAYTSDPEQPAPPEPYIPDARYYKLPDGSIYTAPDDDLPFMLGFAIVRDSDAEWQKLTAGETWNDLRVKYAQSGWWYSGTSYSTADAVAHHQLINFIGEKTFTGKAEILYAADDETPAYTVFFLDEEVGGEMPLFPSYHAENGSYDPVFFTLYHEDHNDKYDEITALLLEGKEVTVTVTTDDFMWEYSDYGLSIDGRTRGYFNTISSFEISVI